MKHELLDAYMAVLEAHKLRRGKFPDFLAMDGLSHEMLSMALWKFECSLVSKPPEFGMMTHLCGVPIVAVSVPFMREATKA